MAARVWWVWYIHGGSYTYSGSSGTAVECALASQCCWEYVQAMAARVLWVWYIHGGTYTHSSSALGVRIQ